jgi:hypothetical protein
LASTFSQAAVKALLTAMKTQASESGLFRKVLSHEPKSSPGNGVTYALWMGPVTPVPNYSGLAATAGRIVMYGRVYVPWIQSDEDTTETQLVHCILEMIAAYSGTITVGGTVNEVDLLGAYGVALESGTVGYIEHDGTHYRAAELTIPVIIDALWTQVD